MRRPLPPPLARVAARIRDDATLPASSAQLFELILELVDYLAACEHLIRAREPRLEPDLLAGRLLADPQVLPLRRINALLRGLTRHDLRRIENLLLDLEGRHGMARTTPANFRLLVDGAVLGRVGFVYSRKYREVIAARSLDSLARPGLLLPDLLQRADRVFPARPGYLWRLGPEFGTDRNIRLVLGLGDSFIVRSPYRARARRLARSVLRWSELGDGWVGESCEPAYPLPTRQLVLRTRRGRRWDYALLATNLENVSWEEIVRFYRNRSGKRASRLAWEPSISGALRSRLAASFLIFAIFTFRNLDSWAATAQLPGTDSGYAAEPLSEFREVTTPRLLEQIGLAIDYLGELTNRRLSRIKPVAGTLSYRLRHRGEVGPLTGGRVCEASGLRRTVTIDHGGGLSSVYRELRPSVRVGQVVDKSDVIGTAQRELHFEARLFVDAIDKGHEPRVCEVLSAEQHATIDPLRLLCCERPWRFFADLWRFSRVRAPEFESVYLMEDRALGRRILFPSAGAEDPSRFRLEDAEDRLEYVLASAFLTGPDLDS